MGSLPPMNAPRKKTLNLTETKKRTKTIQRAQETIKTAPRSPQTLQERLMAPKVTPEKNPKNYLCPGEGIFQLKIHPIRTLLEPLWGPPHKWPPEEDPKPNRAQNKTTTIQRAQEPIKTAPRSSQTLQD